MGKNNKVIQGQNDLYTWCQNNEEYGQQLISEWTGICSNGKHYEITNVTKRSHKNMMWRCPYCSNTWNEEIHYRTLYKTLCRHCKPLYNSTKFGTSYPEQFIYWSLKQIYPLTVSRGKFQGVEYDITIPETKTCIEYSPTSWHEDKTDRDQLKADICKEYNVRFIYIREDTYREFNECWKENYICFHMKQSERKELCIQLSDYILKLFQHSINEIDIEYADQMALEYSRGKIEFKDSLENNESKLAKEWNYNLNKVKPSEVNIYSHYKAYWICSKCNYGAKGEWQTTVARRSYNKTGCPQCGYNWYKAQIGQPQKLKKGYALKIQPKSEVANIDISE